VRHHAKASSVGSTAGAVRPHCLLGLIATAALLACLVIGVSGASAYLTVKGSFGALGDADGRFVDAIGVAVNEASGDVYVVDSGNDRVQRFDPDGNFLSKFGSAGSGPGQFEEPQAIAVDQASGDLYVADRGNDRVQQFDADGTFVNQFGGAGSGDGQMSKPRGVAIDPSSGDVLVADTGNNRIQRFNANGEFQAKFGEAGGGDGQFTEPWRVAVDSTGDVYVMERFGRVQKLSGTGAHIATVVGTSFPVDLTIDSASDHLLVADIDANFEFVDVSEFQPSGAKVESYRADRWESTLNFGLAYNAATGNAYLTNGDHVVIMETPPPVFSQTAAPTYTEAAVGGWISREGEETTYYFEYGLTPAYGQVTATKRVAAGAGPVRVSAQLLGLEEGTTYHFRTVAINGHGESRGEDRTFTTLSRAAGSAGCPNADIREDQGANQVGSCRAFELVSPQDKVGTDVYIHAAQSSLDGESVAFQAAGAFAGSEGAAHGNEYISRRGPGGWTTQGITPLQTPDPNAGLYNVHAYKAFTADLSRSVLMNVHDPNERAGDASQNQPLLYLRREGGTYLQISPPAAKPGPFVMPEYVGSSTDMSKVFFESQLHLTADAPPEGTTELYEWDGGKVSVVGVLPNDEIAAAGARLGRGPTQTDVQTAVSGDGSQVVFESGSPSQVYLRTGGSETVAISLSQKTGSVGVPAPSGASFVGSATSDGRTLSKIYLVSQSELTDDAFTGPSEAGRDLYEYDVASEELRDLTVSLDPANPNGAQVGAADDPSDPALLGSANDGSYVYFKAAGMLAPGGKRNDTKNLYVEHDGEIRFVARLFSFVPAVVSENGEKALIFTRDRLTRDETNGFMAAYLYDAPSDELTCISCPDGRPAAGDASRSGFLTGFTALSRHAERNLSPDGKRVYFDTTDALDPRDSNGQEDVYEWQEGRGVSLVSSGRGSEGAFFLDASPSGRDVFIITRERLLSADRDSNLDVYDARSGGGLPLPPLPAPACEGDACQAPPSPPNDATPASAGFRGAGNEVSKSKRHAKKPQARKRHAKKLKAKKRQAKKRQQERGHKAAGKNSNRRHG